MSKSRFIFTDTPREPYVADYRIFHGLGAFSGLIGLADKSVRCIITSPPYYRKFDYGVEGQCGLEETMDEYLEYQVKVAREMLRVATPDGNLFFVIQDTWNGSGGPGGDYKHQGFAFLNCRPRGPREKNIPLKSQLLIPERIRLAFSEIGWVPRIRIVWNKNDPRRGAVDRPSYSYEEILLFSASPRNYWNQAAVRSPYSSKSLSQLGKPYKNKSRHNYKSAGLEDPSDTKRNIIATMQQAGTARVRAVWDLPSGSQPKVIVDGKLVRGLACFPLTLAEICVNLGSAPGDTVLDPFSGMGTTLLAAVKWGRKAIGIELNEEFARAAVQRIKDAGYGNGNS